MSLWNRLRDRVRPALDKVGEVADPDYALMLATSALIERARETWPDDRTLRWRPGEPLRLLFAGYSGTRNTGADVRVEEMIRQFRHVLGDEHIDLTILTHDPKLTRGYFRTAKQLQMPVVFPKFLFDTVRDQHGVVACEGSMFKSKFADALSTFMAGGLGLATAGDKLAIAYGGEAGAMSPALQRMVSRYVQDAFVITRNQESRDVLADLGVDTLLGTDTAWTFEPADPYVGRELLKSYGWDGETPIVAICPINAFWWPVRPDPTRAAARALLGAHERDHYRSIYFHAGGPDVAERQERYVEGLARGVAAFAARHKVFPVCIGSEQLDRSACERVSELIGGAPVLVSDEIEMFEMVSAMRTATYMVSSRYHAIVTSMPEVLSVGVTMDERIRNLMVDRGTPELALEVDDPDLARKVDEALERVASDPEGIRRGTRATVVRNLHRMGEMGVMLASHVSERLPRFPLRDGIGRRGDPWAHLPPLSPALTELVDDHRSAA
jgi:polysaccharide pyruvyl transferase WcaK-like protein